VIAVSTRLRRLLGAATPLILVLLALALGAGPASAATTHVFSSAFGAEGAGEGQFSSPSAVAVDQISGDVYVLDAGNSRVEQFSSTGSFIAAFGSSGSANGQFSGPNGIAVDNSGLLSGDVYVVDAGNNRVERFSPAGVFVASLSTTGGGTVAGVAVGPTGNVWVYANDATVDEYDSTGTHLNAFNTNFGVTPGLAVDAAENLYILRGTPFVEEVSNTGTDVGTVDPCGCATGVAVDAVTGEVYSDQGSAVAVFKDLSGTASDAFGSGSLTGGAGLALNTVSKTVYVADSSANQVAIFTAVTLPDATTGVASSITTTSATVGGTVNPQSTATTYQFEYGTDTSYGSVAPASPGDAGSGSSDVPVSANLSGLLPNTTYHYRLNASNGNGTSHGADEVFTTASAPLVDGESVGTVGSFDAVLQAQLNPLGFQTSYRFEYGTTPAYGATSPIPEGSAGAGSSDQSLSSHVSGLQAATVYHYRIVATNVWGTTNGPDKTFRTFELPSASLPDNRAYELVSPGLKNGGDVISDTARTRAAADGSAASFISLQGFSDVRGTGIATEYLSQRSANPNPGDSGWSTHAITPAQEPLSLFGVFQAQDPLWVGEFSPDLSRGVFRAWSPLTNAPNVANVQNLYSRTDLRTPGTGSYQLATDCPACGNTPLPSNPTGKRLPFLAGTSADFSHVLFESALPLTAGTPPQPPQCATNDQCQPRLYESVNGVVRLAGVLPDSACGSPPCVPTIAVAGQGASQGFYTPHVISADGSRVFFTDISASGGRLGNIYMRVNGSSTVQLNASEKTVPDAPQDAEFWTASRDGSRIFFTTSEALTNDDTNGVVDLYMYDVNAPAGAHLTRLSVDSEPADVANSVRGVIGASDDGHYVYFVSDGQLVTGKPLISFPGIYLWHDGVVSYVGEMSDPGTDTAADMLNGWSLNPLQSRVSPDGRRLLFASHSGVGLLSAHGGVDYDHGHGCGPALFDVGGSGCQELYLYSAPSGGAGSDGLVCVSCNPSGAPGTQNGNFTARSGEGGALTSWHLNHPLADDGSRVFFSTRDALVAGDSNGKVDVYEYDTASASLHLISSGKDPSDSYFMDASSSGNDAFFATRQQLVGWDTDQNYDLYDARVGGGFPEPVKPAPGCSGDGCQGSNPPSTPPAGSAASSTISGPGNASPGPAPPTVKPLPRKAARCRHGFVHRRIKHRLRCVKVRAHHGAPRHKP
jgi:hypothetical protein